ncbi:MAG: flagellum-specific ATP synthase FliI, partial [Pseudomonadota bacterium]|nr:flagellum-specific ATP synthase FliI [Pseudomonadota bacterium]
MSAQSMTLSERLQRYEKHIKAPKPAVAGILTRVVGLTLEAKGLRAPVGSQCKIETINGFVDAEVVGFNDQTLYLMPNDHISG